MPSAIIRTQRLALFGPDPALAQAVADYFVRNRAFLTPFEPLRSDAFYLPETQARDMALDREIWARGGGYRYWIAALQDPSRVIGSVALSNIVRGAFQSCNLGYRLDAMELRRGYMTEAAGALVRVAFDELKLHRVEANIMPRNEASLGVVRKLGFLEEGLARQYLKINGAWEDHIHMVLLNDRM